MIFISMSVESSVKFIIKKLKVLMKNLKNCNV